MSAETPGQGPGRLPPVPGEAIDRNATIGFTFDGRPFTACAGDTVASALAAAGVLVLSRSFKYHRPRGILCGAGHCPNCLVQVGDEPNVRSCLRPVAPGMEVRSQNAWPSLRWDAMALTQLASRFLPVGFYYKTFIRPARWWPLYDRWLRNAAGLGSVRRDSVGPRSDQDHLHADVAVVGAGPAGLAAAIAAAESGASVLLFDENRLPGGRFRYRSRFTAGAPPQLPSPAHPRVRLLAATTVVGAYEGRWLAAVAGSRLLKVRARAIVLAAGGYESPLLFEGNDLPGVMLGGAVERLVSLYAVAPGRRAIVVSSNDDGWALAARLHRVGVGVAALVEERRRTECSNEGLAALEAATIPCHFEHTIVAARGRSQVRGAVLAPVSASGEPQRPTATVAGDLIVVCVGSTPALDLAYMLGARSHYDEARGLTLAADLPPGVFVAGRAAGVDGDGLALADGTSAGERAAAFAAQGSVPSHPTDRELADDRRVGSRRAPRQPARPGRGKRFVCLCEDVTAADVDAAVAEGYDAMELLKRYTAISMGPCQGKMCGTTAMQLCARARGVAVAEAGRTTARPPVMPTELGTLAGQRLQPLQRGPLHDWHVGRGARMIVAALALRPEHYGDPAAEVRAVRERVGLIDVSTLGKLRLTGPGTPGFLERVYTNRWLKLGVGQVRYGVMCDDDGVVLDDGVTARLGQTDWYMTTTSAGASAIYEWLQWWRQSGWGDGVHIVNLTEAFAAFNLAGPRSRDVLQSLSSLDLSNAAFPYMAARAGDVAGVPCRLLRIGFTGELSYEVHVPAGYGRHVWDSLLHVGKAAGIVPFGLEAQRVLRLEKGHFIVGQDTDATSDALSAGLEWVVKLDKGDFLGRRSLVQRAERGATQRLMGFTIPGEGVVPEEGLQIVDAGPGAPPAIIGWVTSSRMSPTLGRRIGLCWLPADRARPGHRFTIWRDGELLEAVAHEGPFYDPEGVRLRL
jgi:sarcosine oxidase subunit alpha